MQSNSMLDGVVGAAFVLILFVYPSLILFGLAMVAVYFILKYGFKVLGKILKLLLIPIALIVQGINYVDKNIIKIV